MTKTNYAAAWTSRPVGAKRLKDLRKKFARNVLVLKQDVARGWHDEATGVTYSPFSSFAHFGTSVVFYDIHDFHYRGKKLCATVSRRKARYSVGDEKTQGPVTLEPAADDDDEARANTSWMPLVSDNASIEPWTGEAVSVSQ